MPKKIGILINADDNVVTVVEDTLPGDCVEYMTSQGPRQITFIEAVPMGHKAAIGEIASGQPVLKYNQPIGTASQAIRQGQHVHNHNVQSAVEGASDEN